MFDDDDDDDLFSTQRTLYTRPRKTADYIQLRFQLARSQVYRIVQLPVTFTFANLHTLIQYMFGWSDSHLHQSEVFPNVVLHDDEELLGTIRSCGRKRPLEDYELGDPSAVDHWERFEQANRPIYRVQPKVTHRKDMYDRVMTLEEKGVTLESIWTPNEAHNVSDGQCSNAQIGIVYTYDFGDEWTVHVTCEQGNIFHRLDAINNLPIFKSAQGAPYMEHAQWDMDMEGYPEEKRIPSRFFNVSYFQKYCEGKVTSEARKYKLEILTLEEAEEKRRRYMQREAERMQRLKEKEERGEPIDEDDEMDEESEGDEEDEDEEMDVMT